ncbi:alpha/beta fold hydrolase [Flavobacteriaceae bacterium MHTCC 0001]
METLTDNALSITVNNFTLRAKTWGNDNGKNRILAIHGWLDNANSFNKIAPSLSKGHYIVAIDLAGHGLSDHRDANSSYYIWDYAIDILNCMDELKWKTCTLLAHSLGTGVASIVAGAFPNRVDKLIFIDGIGPPFINQKDQIVHSFKSAHQQFKMAKKTSLYGFSNSDYPSFNTKEDAIKSRMLNRISPISHEAASLLTNRGLKTVTKGYRWRHDPKIVLPECYKMTEDQVLQFIKSITCKALIVLGKQGLFATGLYNSRLDAFRNAKIYWVEGNHHLHLENEPKPITKLIHQFLQNTN